MMYFLNRLLLKMRKNAVVLVISYCSDRTGFEATSALCHTFTESVLFMDLKIRINVYYFSKVVLFWLETVES